MRKGGADETTSEPDCQNPPEPADGKLKAKHRRQRARASPTQGVAEELLRVIDFYRVGRVEGRQHRSRTTRSARGATCLVRWPGFDQLTASRVSTNIRYTNRQPTSIPLNLF